MRLQGGDRCPGLLTVLTPRSLDRLGWSPDGPDAPEVEPTTGWWALQQSVAGDLGRGIDAAAARALSVAQDLGRGVDIAAIRGVLVGAKDLGIGVDKATPRVTSTAYGDLGRGLDTAAGRQKGTAYGDLGRGVDLSSVRALGTARDLGRGADRAATAKVSGTGRDLGRGLDLAAGRWRDTWVGPGGGMEIPTNAWTALVTFGIPGNTAAVFNISITHSWQGSLAQWVTVQRRLRVTVNGAQVGSYASQSWSFNTSWNTTSTWNNVAIPAGASISIEAWSNAPYASTRTPNITAESFVVQSI